MKKLTTKLLHNGPLPPSYPKDFWLIQRIAQIHPISKEPFARAFQVMFSKADKQLHWTWFCPECRRELKRTTTQPPEAETLFCSEECLILTTLKQK